jgi:hypothetical protein
MKPDRASLRRHEAHAELGAGDHVLDHIETGGCRRICVVSHTKHYGCYVLQDIACDSTERD